MKTFYLGQLGSSIMENEFSIIPYRKIYHSLVKEIISKEWSVNHPILNDTLFFWQYQGFGWGKNYSNILLIFHHKSLVGFRATIPGLYQYFDKNKWLVLKGKSAAMWLISKPYRGKMLGFELQKAAMKDCQVFTAINANSTSSVPIFLKNDFNELKSLTRYLMPLDVENYRKLLIYPVRKSELDIWKANINFKYTISPIKCNTSELEQFWSRFSERTKLFSLYRNREFWEWRYMNHPFFNYYFFLEPQIGLIVGRIEKTFSADNPDVTGISIFRIIELVPLIDAVDKNLNTIVDFVKGVVEWSRREGCSAVDFYISNNLNDQLLCSAGFKKQGIDYLPKECSLVGLFSPVKEKPNPLNVYVRINLKNRCHKIDFNNSYIVKSEADADRPNLPTQLLN